MDTGVDTSREPEVVHHVRLVTALFAVASFVSAFLLFVLEPMVAKSMLPKLGGTPMVWNTCVVFFQAALLVGYLSAHLANQGARGAGGAGQARGWARWLYPAALAAAIVLLPLAFTRAPQAGEQPAMWLLGELIRVAGLPTVALSMSAPTLQAWFSRTLLKGADDPYFFYAASNGGSLLALLAYPTIIEPGLGLQPQSRGWAAAYVLLTLVVVACALVTRRFTAPAHRDALPQAAPVSWWQRIRWITLAFIPSSLMLGVTTHISTDVAAVPLIWVLPLALYLATFVIAFGPWTTGAALVAERCVPLLATTGAVLIAASANFPIQFDAPLQLVIFTAVAMMCHGRLAAARPPAERLTEFYFLLSFGGMLGGLFNTLAAPLLFTSVAEYPLVLVCACAVPALYEESQQRDWKRDAGFVMLTAAAAIAVNVMLWHRAEAPMSLRVGTLSAVGLMALTQARHSLRFALILGVMLLASTIVQRVYVPALAAERTFFGTYRVASESGGRFHSLSHGTTLHGLEAIDPSTRNEPLTYYHRRGPLGQAFARIPRLSTGREMAVVGLGTGSAAAYAGESQRWTFFEIDPVVERIARDTRYFHFLETCGARCAVVLGDARLSLARSAKRFDAIILDAFSSDAIPVHLLTREAVDVYLQHLNPGGVLMFHISNRYLRLGPLIGLLAHDRGLAAVEQLQPTEAADVSAGWYASDWVVASSDRAAIDALASDPHWTPLTAAANARVWTDDYSNIVALLKLRR